MSLPFWDQAAIIPKDGTAATQGITTVLPRGSDPYPDELSPWDVITLNGVRAPGICRLDGGKHIPYDRKAALGQIVGPSALFVFDPVSFTLTLTLWTPRQWLDLQTMLPQLLPATGPNPEPRAVKAEHPALAMIGIDTVYFEGVGLPRHIGKQIVEVEFQCYEWRPPLPITPQDIGSPLPQGLQPGQTTAPAPPTPPSQSGIAPG